MLQSEDGRVVKLQGSTVGYVTEHMGGHFLQIFTLMKTPYDDGVERFDLTAVNGLLSIASFRDS